MSMMDIQTHCMTSVIMVRLLKLRSGLKLVRGNMVHSLVSRSVISLLDRMIFNISVFSIFHRIKTLPETEKYSDKENPSQRYQETFTCGPN